MPTIVIVVVLGFEEKADVLLHWIVVSHTDKSNKPFLSMFYWTSLSRICIRYAGRVWNVNDGGVELLPRTADQTVTEWHILKSVKVLQRCLKEVWDG